MLAARTGKRTYADWASTTLSAFAQSIERHPAGFAYMLGGADELLHGGSGPRQYAAAGTVKATARAVREGEDWKIELDLSIRDGWHVSSDQPLSENLIATELTAAEDPGDWVLHEVDYPPAETVRLGFQEEPLNIFQGDVTFTARARPGDDGSGLILPLRLEIQACDDRVCLKPETLVLEVRSPECLEGLLSSAHEATPSRLPGPGDGSESRTRRSGAGAGVRQHRGLRARHRRAVEPRGPAAWLAGGGLGDPPELTPADLERAVAAREALRSALLFHNGAEMTESMRERLGAAARSAAVDFGVGQGLEVRLEAGARGIDGVLGRLFSIVLIAQIEGRWPRLKACANPACRAAFYDFSSNRSGVWCAMRRCGTRYHSKRNQRRLRREQARR